METDLYVIEYTGNVLDDLTRRLTDVMNDRPMTRWPYFIPSLVGDTLGVWIFNTPEETTTHDYSAWTITGYDPFCLVEVGQGKLQERDE